MAIARESQRFREDPRPGRRLAEGAMAMIHEIEGRPDRVLKLAREPRFNATLLREAKVSGEVRHPALLPVLDHGLDGKGRAWLVLPRLGGSSLSDLSLEPRALIEALTPIADVLDRLHHFGWVHGDLKPSNLLEAGRDSGPPLLLSDLGLAGREGEISGGGSPAYSSPSRLSGGPLARADDHFSFSVVLFEALAGRLPFIGREGEALIRSIRRGERHSLDGLRPDLPAKLRQLIDLPLAGERLELGLLAWVDRLRGVLGMEPAPATPFYRSAPYRRVDLLGRVAAWLAVPPGEKTRLGRAVLLSGGGRRESELIRSALSAREPIAWLLPPALDTRAWIGWMEAPVAAGSTPSPAIFSAVRLDSECEQYLRHRADTLILQPEDWRLDDLPAYLEAGLSSAAHETLDLGSEVSRCLEESSRGDLWAAEELLAQWIEESVLVEETGRAFSRFPLAGWKPPRNAVLAEQGLSGAALALRDLLSTLDLPLDRRLCAEILGLEAPALDLALQELSGFGLAETVGEEARIRARGPGLVEGLPWISFRLDPARLSSLWKEGKDRPEARLSILAQALHQRASAWLRALEPGSLLELGDRISLARLVAFVRAQWGGLSLGALGILVCLADHRAGRLPEAVAAYWRCEAGLDLACSAELSRRLSADLLSQGGLEDGFAFLERWRRARKREIAGRDLEIRVAAREAVSHGRFVSIRAGRAKVAAARAEFAGRGGLWFLDWAEGILLAESRDRAGAGEALGRAFAGMPGDADPRDRFSLCIRIANHHILMHDLEEGRRFLDRAARVARNANSSELDRFLEASRALYANNSGDAEGAERHNRRALRLAKEAGLWREPVAERNNLASALLRLGEFGRLQPVLREIERHVELAEQLSSAMQERNLLSRAKLVLGDLEACRRYLGESLSLASEMNSPPLLATALKIRGELRRVTGENSLALADFQLAEAGGGAFLPPGARWELRLGILEAEGRLDRRAEEEMMAVADEARGRGEKFLLAEAVRLRVSLLRRRKDLAAAEAACRESFREIENAGNALGLAALLAEWSRVEQDRGELVDARRRLGRGLEILRSLSQKLPEDADRRRFLARPDRAALLERYLKIARN